GRKTGRICFSETPDRFAAMSFLRRLRDKENQLMPLRDHFRPPLDDLRHWEGFHATWPVMIVALLRRQLPRRYFAKPRVHSGASAEIDVATFENEGKVFWPPVTGTTAAALRPRSGPRR